MQRAGADNVVAAVATVAAGDAQTADELGQVAIATRPENPMPGIGHDAPAQEANRTSLLRLVQDPTTLLLAQSGLLLG